MGECTLRVLRDFLDRALFEVPDYQRGYAWTRKEVEDFWNDLATCSLHGAIKRVPPTGPSFVCILYYSTDLTSCTTYTSLHLQPRRIDRQ